MTKLELLIIWMLLEAPVVVHDVLRRRGRRAGSSQGQSLRAEREEDVVAVLRSEIWDRLTPRGRRRMIIGLVLMVVVALGMPLVGYMLQ
jgi:hypothetical protein